MNSNRWFDVLTLWKEPMSYIGHTFSFSAVSRTTFHLALFIPVFAITDADSLLLEEIITAIYICR